MAFEVPGFKLGVLVCGSVSLATKQFCFVKLHTDGTVLICAATTDKPIGILQNKPRIGEACEIMVTGVSKLKMAAASAIDSMIGTDGSGLGAIYVAGTDTTKYLVARVLLANAAASGIASVLVNCMPAQVRGA